MLYKFIWIEGPYQLRKYIYSRMRYIGALPEPLKVSLIKSKLSLEKEKKINKTVSCCGLYMLVESVHINVS